MKKVISSAFLIILFVLPQTKTKSQSIIGQWENELGSTLAISSLDTLTGQIGGYYISPSGTEGYRYPLVGWVNMPEPKEGLDNVWVITFTVQWGGYGSLTAWSGTINMDDYTIHTLWHLVRANTKFSFEHTLTGNDNFFPVKS